MDGRGRRTLAAPALLVVSVGAALVVFWPVVGSFFYADDFCWFFDFANYGWVTSLLRPWGGHVAVGAKLVTDVMYRVIGMHPRPYYVLTLVAHLVNVALVFLVGLRLTGRAVLACLTALMWGTMPAHQSVLAWSSAHGTILATTLVLVVLAGVARRSRDAGPITARTAAAWGATMIVAS